MKRRALVVGMLLLLTCFAFLLQGYHPGAEDDGVYLCAIKHDLNSSLYPYDAQFFTLQMQATVFDKVVAASVRLCHLPLSYVILVWQLAAIAGLLAGCWRMAGLCYSSLPARLAGVLTICCLLTLSVAGTALYLSDEHLHPRLLATDALLFAIHATQRRKPLRAVGLLLIGFVFHPMMAMFGISFCVLYGLVCRTGDDPLELPAPVRAAAIPGAWLLAPATPAWRQALQQHSYYALTRWEWYEWLGAIAPPLLLFLLARFGRRRGNVALAHMALSLSLFSTVQLGVAMAMLFPPAFQRLEPLQPMRYLHLTFLLMFLLAGATLGEYVLRADLYRWILVFLPLAAANGYAQRTRYPATRNLEMPWQAPQGPWAEAFAWVRINTPKDAVFALDPHYLALPEEDNHSFRALAERSALADAAKDAAVVTQVPKLAEDWVAQQNAQAGWDRWIASDFRRLGQSSTASWVLVASTQARGLVCPYANRLVSVCNVR